MKHTFRVLVMLLTGTVCAHAQGYGSSTAEGAVIGGVAGAVIGNNSGGHHAGQGAIIGAVAGALIGHAVEQPPRPVMVPAPCPPQPTVVYVQPSSVVQAVPSQQVVVAQAPVVVYQQAPTVIYVDAWGRPINYNYYPQRYEVRGYEGRGYESHEHYWRR